MDSEVSLQSKTQPKILQWLAILFLMAPFGNILLSFVLGNLQEHSWSSLVGLIGEIGWLDGLWLALMFFTGFLLLMRHKGAWLLAIMTLLLGLTVNASLILEGEGYGLLRVAWEIQVFFSLFLSVSVIILLFYARYPYLDRRQGWVRRAADRYDLKVPVRIVGDGIYLGETESLSLSGCRIQVGRPWGRADRLRFVELVFPDCEGIRIKAQVVGVQDSVIRLKFRDFLMGHGTDFHNWVESLVSKQA